MANEGHAAQAMRTIGHTVLITGGATGIGFALAEKFHRAGNAIILVGRTQAALDQAAQKLPHAKTFACDVTQAEDRARLVQAHPDVSVLVNNAGVRFAASFAACTEADLLSEIQVNLLAPILLAQAYLPHLKRQASAAIINVTSGAALVPREVAAMYSATKTALHSYTKSMRWQLENDDIRVFEVMPPVVRTAMTAFQKSSNPMLTPERLADEFWAGFQADKFEMHIGNIKLLYWLRRLSPAFAHRLARRIPGEE